MVSITTLSSNLRPKSVVVICLKSCIFVVSITTLYENNAQTRCCDLLKKLYLCGVNYNIRSNKPLLVRVVICLKSCIFVVSITTPLVPLSPCGSCDLLKKLYLCGVNYNQLAAMSFGTQVVICLKSCIFVVSITTACRCAAPI